MRTHRLGMFANLPRRNTPSVSLCQFPRLGRLINCPPPSAPSPRPVQFLPTIELSEFPVTSSGGRRGVRGRCENVDASPGTPARRAKSYWQRAITLTHSSRLRGGRVLLSRRDLSTLFVKPLCYARVRGGGRGKHARVYHCASLLSPGITQPRESIFFNLVTTRAETRGTKKLVIWKWREAVRPCYAKYKVTVCFCKCNTFMMFCRNIFRFEESAEL